MLQDEFSLHQSGRQVGVIPFHLAVSSPTPGLQILQFDITGHLFNVLPTSLWELIMFVTTNRYIHKHSNHRHLFVNVYLHVIYKAKYACRNICELSLFLDQNEVAK